MMHMTLMLQIVICYIEGQIVRALGGDLATGSSTTNFVPLCRKALLTGHFCRKALLEEINRIESEKTQQHQSHETTE